MRKIGFDIGSSSVGWFIREGNVIIKHGVVTFQSGMVKGTGGYSSPTMDRREERSKRNLIKARKYRKWALLEVLIQDEMVPLSKKELEVWSHYKKGTKKKFPDNERFLKWLGCDFTYLNGGIKYKNPYELRVQAIDNTLRKYEFGRALYHLVQRRGYKDIGESDQETEKQIERRKESGFNLAKNNNRTIAEALSNEFLNKGKRARNEYPYRVEYQEELEIICKGQGYNLEKDGRGKYLDEFVQKLWSAIIWQRPLRSQKGNIGKCTLEPTKQRCPISHPLFEVFRTWQFINTVKIIDDKGNKQFLSQELRTSLFDFFLKQDKNFKFEEIKKHLDKQTKSKSAYNYPISKKTGKHETSVAGMPICKGLIKLFGADMHQAIVSMHNYNIGNAPKIINGYSVYDVWHLIFNTDSDFIAKFGREKLGIEDVKVTRKGKVVTINPAEQIKAAMPSGYADLSLKAIRRIIPFLQEGLLYNEAVLLAKMPSILSDGWNESKETIYRLFKSCAKEYNFYKVAATIANNLINKYKGLPEDEIFAYKNIEYQLAESDFTDVLESCKSHYGEESWNVIENKNELLKEVEKQYQSFFQDSKRGFRKVPLLTDIFKNKLALSGIELKEELYHHSNRENLYNDTIEVIDEDGEMHKVLSVPLIDSIKNPMFNKAMSVLRRITNALIINGDIDEDTDVIIEVARDLNDNNKRSAIESYQNARQRKREKYREFLTEFKNNEASSINIEESLLPLELWAEQIFESKDLKEEKNKSINDLILSEKKALKRYELWTEQKGQCMYTGKMISISQLFSDQIQKEHTIPRTLLPDNTRANQTVCFRNYNNDVKNNKMPSQCPNYSSDTPEGSAILPRLDKWITIRDNWKDLYESRKKGNGREDIGVKNKRIQEKHLYRMHYEYWKDKIDRFTATEINESWARRQLVDTQMVSKYAREFLKTFFKKVSVQKGSVTASFRKIYSFQEADEIKSRNRHTHHAIDAAVLTLIPSNSSYRDRLLNKMFEMAESGRGQFCTKPQEFPNFNSQQLIKHIEENTLVVNYSKDKITEQTYRNVRKRGQQQFLKRNGEFILDVNGEKIKLVAKGDTIRTTLYKDTFLAKIRDVEKDEKGQAITNVDGSWKYKKGKDEFAFVTRKPIGDVLSKIKDIVDPTIRNLIQEQLSNGVKENFKDPQGNVIRHVRIYTNSGKEVKERINYKSKHEYKNQYYAQAGSIPYAILLERVVDEKVERVMFPVASFEVAKVFKKYKSFSVEQYLEIFKPDLPNYSVKRLLKIGQKVFVLKTDTDYEKKLDIDFQRNRLYKITQFASEGNKIMLKYHLVAQPKIDIDKEVKKTKDKILFELEQKNGIQSIDIDESIVDRTQRIKDFERRLYNFTGRVKQLSNKLNEEEVLSVTNAISKYKTECSELEVEGNTPLLKMTSKNWNFLYEGYDFDISILGDISWFPSD